ncbi:resolvase [Rhodococcus sp. MS16]|uniref:recombinase family protein n=1 Tax=Rhodococcus sp. MS16 TaxID=2579941 RepID=UPI001562D367|nr:recombinase family protein [Rhodococcus sp. MS16]NRI68757.1 resolvase [Rhodococcus sp. MS16]
MLIGYARCASSMDGDEQGQRAALVALGVDADFIHIDHGLTGTDRPRPALTAALSALAARDTLVVTTLERLARSVTDLSEIATDLAQRDVLLMFAGTVHDPKDPIGATVFDMLSQTFSTFETGLIHLRTMEGNARRKATGGFAGRTPLLDAKQQAKLFDLHSRREHSIAELAKMFNLSKPGVYKYVAREKNLRSEPGSSSTTD